MSLTLLYRLITSINVINIFGKRMHLDDMDEQWQGSIDELAAIAAKFTAQTDEAGTEPRPNPRLIRDYVARGIMSKPERVGKEARYDFRHLVEFLACRRLVSDGWPLSKIADDFSRSSFEEIRALIPGQDQTTEALDLIRSFREPVMREEAIHDVAPRAMMSAPDPDLFSARSRRDLRNRARLRDFKKTDKYRHALKEFDESLFSVIRQDMTAFQLASWVVLLIDQDRLNDLTRDDIEDIGEAVKAALLDRTNIGGRY